MTHQSRRTFLRTVGVAGGAALTMGSVSAQQAPIRIRGVHAAPDAPAVNLLVNGEPILEGATFPTVGGYFEGQSGTLTIEAVPADGGEPIIVAKRSFDPGTVHTASIAGAGDDAHLEMLVDRIEQPESGKAGWRAVNLMPDAPGVDVVAKGRQKFFHGVEFGEQSRYRSIQPGTYAITLQQGSADEQLRSFEGAAFESGTVYSAFFVGTLSGEPRASLLLAEDASFSG